MMLLANSFLVGTVCFYLGYNYTSYFPPQPIPLIQPPKTNTFSPETVRDYMEARKQPNKYILYSHYHKCALSTHQLIMKQFPSLKQFSQIFLFAPTPSQSESPTKADEQAVKIVAEQTAKPKSQVLEHYKSYGRQLVEQNTCNSVQLIWGPIFSKDTPYKVEKEIIKNVFVSQPKINPAGEWQADRFYTIVVCNKTQGTYFNVFSYRNTKNPVRFLNHLTTLKKIEEQTGLIFNIAGQQLTRIDYAGVAKEREFDETEKLEKVEPNLLPEA